jgi:AP-3 complex subunit mu
MCQKKSVASSTSKAPPLPICFPLEPEPLLCSQKRESGNRRSLGAYRCQMPAVWYRHSTVLGYDRVDLITENAGMPDLLLTLSDPTSLEDTSFHPCVRCVWIPDFSCPKQKRERGFAQTCANYYFYRLQKWANNCTISFVPPDGRFTLMRYRLGPPSSLSTPGGLGKRGGAIAIPLSLKAKVTVGQAGGQCFPFPPVEGRNMSRANAFRTGGGATGSFRLTLTARHATRPIESIALSFHLGQGATDVNATVTGGQPLVGGPGNRTVASKEAGGGDVVPGGRWSFDAGVQELRWNLAKLTTGDRPPTLTGTWNR